MCCYYCEDKAVCREVCDLVRPTWVVENEREVESRNRGGLQTYHM